MACTPTEPPTTILKTTKERRQVLASITAGRTLQDDVLQSLRGSQEGCSKCLKHSMKDAGVLRSLSLQLEKQKEGES